MPIEKNIHVFDGIDGHAALADFAQRKRVVGIHADLRRQVKRYGKAGLALVQEIAITLVGFRGAGETCVLAHGPEAAAVHGGINTASVGKLAGIADGFLGIRGG